MKIFKRLKQWSEKKKIERKVKLEVEKLINLKNKLNKKAQSQ